MRASNNRTYYSHTLVAPLLVAPGQRRVIALEPEFVRPQDGVEKQDCELRAAERWLQRNAVHFGASSVTLLGDDLYCHQPFCELVVATGWHFVFTCKPTSHPALYEEVDLLTKAGGVAELTEHHVVDGHPQVWHYRYVSRLPLRADTHPMYVNWCEVTITTPDGALLYHNAWATDHPLTAVALHTFVLAARTLEERKRKQQRPEELRLSFRTQLRPRRSVFSPGLGHAQPAGVPVSYRPGAV